MRFLNWCRIGLIAVLMAGLLRPAVTRPESVVDAVPPQIMLIRQMDRGDVTVWMAPAEFDAWLLLDTPNAAAPYYFVYPWTWLENGSDLMVRLTETPPDILMYRRNVSIAMIPGWELDVFAPQLSKWVDDHYTPVPGVADMYLLSTRYNVLMGRIAHRLGVRRWWVIN